ncbi:MAG: carbohydrate kinase family protein [Candidatus Acidiferrales bacterium]
MTKVGRVDVVGVGLNATDTIIRLPRFPEFDSKMELISHDVRAGGQVASAMVACRRWGLSARYIGKIGEDWAGEFQRRELESDDVESHLFPVAGCESQRAYILVDEASGERTILWKRDARLEIRPEELRRDWITSASALLVDAHDTAAATQAAQWAREAGIPVIVDVDNRYSGVQVLLEHMDFVIGSRDFPAQLTGESDLLKSLPMIHEEFKCRLTGATLGKDGVIAWDGARFLYARAFDVRAIDTTGAGDIFHAAFVYGVVKGWPCERLLEFSCAAAGLACTAIGARAGIATLAEIEHLMKTGAKHAAVYEPGDLGRVARAV